MKKCSFAFFIFPVLTFASSLSFATLKFVQASDSGGLVEIAENKVEASCGKNFVFRELKKEEAPEYLKKEIIKAAFKGEMTPSLETGLSALKSSKGRCFWFTAEEFATVKLN